MKTAFPSYHLFIPWTSSITSTLRLSNKGMNTKKNGSAIQNVLKGLHHYYDLCVFLYLTWYKIFFNHFCILIWCLLALVLLPISFVSCVRSYWLFHYFLFSKTTPAFPPAGTLQKYMYITQRILRLRITICELQKVLFHVGFEGGEVTD